MNFQLYKEILKFKHSQKHYSHNGQYNVLSSLIFFLKKRMSLLSATSPPLKPALHKQQGVFKLTQNKASDEDVISTAPEQQEVLQFGTK